MAELRIRQAKIYDVPALARIEEESFVSPWSPEEIARDVVMNERAFVAVAELDGIPVGYADMWLVAGEAQLYKIVVDPAYRRSSIGKKLLEYMVRVAMDSCSVMTLEVRRSNIPALALYGKGGFRDVGVRRGYYSDNGEDAILMNKDLDTEDSSSGNNNDLEVDVEII